MPTVKDMEATLAATWTRVWGRVSAVGMGAVSEAERTFAAIWMLQAEVDNGGTAAWGAGGSGS